MRIGGSRRLGRRASWLSYAAVLMHHARIAEIERLLRDTPMPAPSPERKARAWRNIQAKIAARQMHP